MANFTQHVLKGTVVPAVVEFDTAEQLLAIPLVAKFARLFEFHRFSVDHREAQWIILLAEYRGSQSCVVVVGFLDQPVPLPRWEGVECRSNAAL